MYWLPLAAVLLHICEEFFYPGGFAEWDRAYRRSPGVVTGVLVYLPLAFWGFAHFVRSGAAWAAGLHALRSEDPQRNRILTPADSLLTTT